MTRRSFGVISVSPSTGMRISPSFNPEIYTAVDAADVLSWTVQNRIGMALIMVAIIALSFGRAEQRERMLSG